MSDRKDLDKTGGKTPSKAPASRNEVSSFLDKVAAMPPTGKTSGKRGRLVFALDATASRQASWDRAMQLQSEMFSATQSLGGLDVQLCYFRGFAEFHASSWHRDAAGLLQHMTGIHCEAGTTKIERLLRHVLKETRQDKINAVVFIGDCMEENIDKLAQLAGELGLFNVPVFVFQEGHDPIAASAFREIARLSRGAYAPFDESSVAELQDLLKAVAVYASGGLKALENFSQHSHPAVKRLSHQLR